MSKNKNVEIILQKQEEQDIIIECPSNIKLTLWQTYLVLRFDFPPLNVKPKDWKGFFLVLFLFIAFIGLAATGTTGGIIVGILLFVVNIYYNSTYYFRYIQKKLNQGYSVSADQLEILKEAGLDLSNTVDPSASNNIVKEELSTTQEQKVQPLETTADNIPNATLNKEQEIKPTKKKKKVIIGIVAIIVVLVAYFSFSSSGDDEYVEFVKYSYLQAYPDTMMVIAFDSFLANPKWEHIISEDGNHYVNISGGMTYDGESVQLSLQYLLDIDKKYYEFQAMELNDIPQNLLMYNQLISVVFED